VDVVWQRELDRVLLYVELWTAIAAFTPTLVVHKRNVQWLQLQVSRDTPVGGCTTRPTCRSPPLFFFHLQHCHALYFVTGESQATTGSLRALQKSPEASLIWDPCDAPSPSLLRLYSSVLFLTFKREREREREREDA
jgi:hypothetical protein